MLVTKSNTTTRRAPTAAKDDGAFDNDNAMSAPPLRFPGGALTALTDAWGAASDEIVGRCETDAQREAVAARLDEIGADIVAALRRPL